ncbi:DUF4837 domain-containing protein [Echinicola strongylocentroti]|uniref:DUF4837 domain-containing protein n=1 Tax=Echinicola strongylocentroti TaxID=1795355 RepID=A0A2Z4IFX2_9BACT|nr:DUF4837 family protein [Echinicola strongylocentroti]AWW29388.1 DUF4837 domain-containing protein [Echinicola strongylocentroti]
MNKRKSLILALLIFTAGLVISCTEGEDGDNSNKPRARGASGEILLVIDSLKYKGPVGDALKGIFEEDIKGLVREETLFDMRKVDPRSMTRILKMAYNIVYVTTFDDKKPGSRMISNQFSPQSKEKAAADPSLFMLRNEDEFARGQEVVYLFGNNEEDLINNLRKNKEKLQNLFEVRERNRLGEVILSRTNGAVQTKGEEILGLDLTVPASYQFVKEEENFLWARQPTPTTKRADISLIFYQTDYTSEEQVFPENLIAFRDQILKTRVFGDPEKPNSYLETEKQIVPSFRNMEIDGHYAIEMRGQWKTHTISMGGSFVSYAVVDEAKGKLYYLEGFLYYPSETHKKALREIEAILMATKFPEAPKTKSKL